MSGRCTRDVLRDGPIAVTVPVVSSVVLHGAIEPRLDVLGAGRLARGAELVCHGISAYSSHGVVSLLVRILQQLLVVLEGACRLRLLGQQLLFSVVVQHATITPALHLVHIFQIVRAVSCEPRSILHPLRLSHLMQSYHLSLPLVMVLCQLTRGKRVIIISAVVRSVSLVLVAQPNLTVSRLFRSISVFEARQLQYFLLLLISFHFTQYLSRLFICMSFPITKATLILALPNLLNFWR